MLAYSRSEYCRDAEWRLFLYIGDGVPT